MVTTPTLWKSETQVNVADGGLQQFEPKIVALLDGGYYVIWTDRSGVYNAGGGAIVGQKYDFLGEKVGSEVEISDAAGAGDFSGAAIALNTGVNRLRIVFEGENVGLDDVHNLRWNPVNNTLAAVDAGIGAIGETLNLSAVGTSTGSLFAYTRGSGADTDIVGGRGNSGFAFDIHNETDNSDASELAALSDGTYVAVWHDEVNGNAADRNIEFALFTFDDNVPFATGVVAGAAGSADEINPDVAGLTSGRFAVVWEESGSVHTSVYANDGRLAKADVLVGTGTGARATELADGGFVVSWSGGGVTSGQRFDAAGNLVGAAFEINASAGIAEGTLLNDGRVAFVTTDFSGGSDFDVMTSIWDPRTSVVGTQGDDILTSRRDGASVSGLGGADTLYGFEGSDRLIGGLGSDILTGGAGHDIFDFNSIKESGKTAATRDHITDFSHLTDDIDVRTIDANTKVGGNQNFKFIGTAAFHHKAGELHYVKQNLSGTVNDKTIVEGDVNGDGKADFQIELTGLKTLTAGDFVL